MSMLSIILWILFGAIAGWIASRLVPTERHLGLGLEIVVGIIGALIGGFLVRLLGGSGITGFNIYSLIVAIIGAVILLLLVQALRPGRHIENR